MKTKMNYLLPAMLGSAMYFASSASADVLSARVEVGAGAFKSDYSAQSAQLGLDAQSDISDKYMFAAARFEHFIPLVPNIRVDYSVSGMDELSDRDLKDQAVTLYYEILDNVVSLDVGVSVRKVDYLSSTVSADLSFADLAFTKPQLYGNAEIYVPHFGVDVGVIAFMGLESDNVSKSFDAYIKYPLMDNLVLDVNAKFGYQIKEVDFDKSGVQLNLSTQAVYASVEFVF